MNYKMILNPELDNFCIDHNSMHLCYFMFSMLFAINGLDLGQGMVSISMLLQLYLELTRLLNSWKGQYNNNLIQILICQL
jgi:hypothetical protein